jgi:hypothetical protein
MSKPRKALRKPEEKLLWSSSAGLCNNPGCRQPLVFEDIGKPVCIGDNAHVIAHSCEGPRGQVDYDAGTQEPDRDSWRNIILLCRNCHKRVDDDEEVYTPEVLFDWKAKHEEWVRTRLADVENSIAIVHKTMGPPVDAVYLGNMVDIKILGLVPMQFQVEESDEDGTIDWAEGQRKNREGLKEVKRLMDEHEGVVIQVFPLSHIPLLVHFGSIITDTVPVQVFQYDRTSGKWVLGSAGGEVSHGLKLTSDFVSKKSSKLVVTLATSASIPVHDVNDAILLDEVDLLQIAADSPYPDMVLYKEDVQEVVQRFRREVTYRIGQQGYDEIHLFLAVPAGLALEVGRAINPNMWPRVYTYHYRCRERPRYQVALYV